MYIIGAVPQRKRNVSGVHQRWEQLDRRRPDTGATHPTHAFEEFRWRCEIQQHPVQQLAYLVLYAADLASLVLYAAELASLVSYPAELASLVSYPAELASLVSDAAELASLVSYPAELASLVSYALLNPSTQVLFPPLGLYLYLRKLVCPTYIGPNDYITCINRKLVVEIKGMDEEAD